MRKISYIFNILFTGYIITDDCNSILNPTRAGSTHESK